MLVEAPFLDLLRGALRASWRPGTFHYPKQHGTVVSSLLSPAVVTSGVWQGRFSKANNCPCRPSDSQVGKGQGPWLGRAQLAREQDQVRRGDWDKSGDGRQRGSQALGLGGAVPRQWGKKDGRRGRGTGKGPRETARVLTRGEPGLTHWPLHMDRGGGRPSL